MFGDIISYVLWLIYFSSNAAAIWPQPQQLETGSSVLWYDSDVDLRIEREPEHTTSRDDQIHLWETEQQVYDADHATQLETSINEAFNRMKDDIVRTSFVPWKFYPPYAQFEPDGATLSAKLQTIEVHLKSNTVAGSNSSEAYHIEATALGLIVVQASSVLGIRHAFTTIPQLFIEHSQGGIYSPYAPFKITDWPRFEHRGLNLDIARNEIMPKDVLRTLEAMKWSKFNRLHLHATDSQSWPLDIPSLPSLARKGAYRHEQIWSAEDLQKVQEFGIAVGIEVFLEIDMPGHTASIFHSYPNLITGYNAPLVNYSASEPPAGQLRLNFNYVQLFLDILLNDLLPRIAPRTRYIHLGGDEFNTNIYGLDPSINSTDKSVIKPYLQSFYDKLLPYVTKHNLTPIFWQEAILEWNLTLPQDSIIQLWRPDSESKQLSRILSSGHRALIGSASYWYLDCGFGTFLTGTKAPYRDWCAPYKSWREVYSYDPLTRVPTELRSKVLGGEVHLWTELTDAIFLDAKLWPRAAAAAEVMWNGIKGEDGATEDVMRRLAELRERLIKAGIGAEVVGMTWCLMNRGGCVV